MNTQKDIKAAHAMYHRPGGYTNLQWVCRVSKILQEYNCMNIEDLVANPTPALLNFQQTINENTLILPKDVFADMYDFYVPDDTKSFDNFMDLHPGCVGIFYEMGEPQPVYREPQGMAAVKNVLQQLNAVTNVALGNLPV